jgi:myo-inositol 2-dehydrogenase/D-chiro-inositol 1-dehydrogenase
MSARQAPLSIGLVGFGRLARDYYLPAFRTLDGGRLVGIADRLPASRAAASARLPAVEVYPDHRNLFDRAKLDAVVVASSPSSHLEIWNDAARRGLAVFMEKPFVLCGQLGAVVRGDPAPRLMLDFNRRFWPAYRRMGDGVRAGTVGRPARLEYALHVDVLSWSTVTRHRLSGEDGGILHDLGSHAIDLAAEVLGGKLESVTAVTRSERWPGDHLQLDLLFADGSQASCDLAYETRTFERLSVEGPRGRLRLADPNMALHFEADGRRAPRLAAACMDAAVFLYRALRRGRSMARFSIASALQAFIRAVASGGPLSPGFEEAVENVRWLEAAERSSAEGQPAERAV